MRNLKKVLSLVLCVAVMLSVMVMGAGAAFSDQADIENTEAVDACSALNIIGGYEDGSFHPERNIKRSEITKMICVALNAGNEPNVSTNVVPTFSDVRGTSAEWAEGYIEACVAQGIVSGVGGGRFNPDGNVTGAQLAKMLLVALGYNADTEKFTGNAWETNVNVRAAQKSLYKGLESMDTSAAVTRDQAAQMVWNAMQAYVVEYKTNIVTDANGNLSTQVVVQDKVVGGTNDKITLLRDKYDALVNIGTLVSIDKTDLRINMSAADAVASDSGLTNFSKLSKDYSSLMGQKVKVIFDANSADKVLGVFATDDNTVYNVVANETSEDDGKVSFGGSSYSIDVTNGGIRTYVDGGASITTTLAQLDNNYLNPNAYTFVDSDGNGRLDTLIVKTYNVAQVTYTDASKIIAAGQTYKFADENIADGIAVDDWIVITPNLYNDNLDISKVDVQTATLAALRTNTNDAIHFESNNNLGNRNYNEYQIGDTWYNGGENIVQSTASENNLKTVKAGDSVDYVAVNGIMFFIQKSTGEFNGKVDNVAMITTMANNGVEDLAKIQLFNGDTKTVTVGERSGSIDFADLKEGVVYEYTVSGDKYYFEALNEGINNTSYEEYYGDLTYRGDKVEGAAADYTVAGQTAAATKNAFDGLTIDNNAEVMLFSVQDDGSVSATTMTGKQYKNLNLANIIPTKPDNSYNENETLATKTTDTSPLTNDKTGDIIAYAFSGTLGGLNRIGALAIQVTDGVDLSGMSLNTWSHYGFILENAKFINNNNKVMSYQLLTENGVIEVQEEYNTLANRQKGMAIGYGDITTADGVNTIDDVDLLDWTSTSGSIFFDAITKVSNDGDTVIFQGGGEQDISDATILYVNTTDSEGVENGTLKTAIKDLNGDYLANALYLEINNSVELVIVEQTDYLRSTYYETNLAGNYIGNAKSGLIYGKNAVSSGTGDNNQGSTTTSGNFTFTTEDKSVLNITSARVASGILTFNLAADNSVDTSTLSYTWTVSIGNTKIDSGSIEKGEFADTVTVKDVVPNDGDQITIALSKFDFTRKLTNSATADQIADELKNNDVTLPAMGQNMALSVPANRTLTVTPDENTLTVSLAEGASVATPDGATYTSTSDTGSAEISTDAVKLNDVSITGTADLSKVETNLAGDVTVAKGGSLTIAAEPDSQPTGDGTLTVAAGGALAVDKVKDTSSSKTLVGPKDARIVTQPNTKVEVTFAGSGNTRMTIAGNATIPEGQTWYSMFGPNAQSANGLDMTLSSGTLTVSGTLKLISGKNGTSLTLGQGATLEVLGNLSVATKASLDATNGTVTGGEKATLSIAAEAPSDKPTGAISGIKDVVRPEYVKENTPPNVYTWSGSGWTLSSEP